jgi:hypothetical protein
MIPLIKKKKKHKTMKVNKIDLKRKEVKIMNNTVLCEETTT